MNITIITPNTEEELEQYTPVIEYFIQFLPEKLRNEINYLEVLKSYLGNLSIFYLESTPIALVTIEMFKRSAEIHGIANLEAKLVIGRKLFSRAISFLQKHIFETIFLENRKEVVITKVPPEAKAVKGFLWRWGFESLNKTDGGREVYRLKKEQFQKVYIRNESQKT